tara:strand:- start:491 stop:865 length:375 start_codon:yes stop_codon:yes gene_type:complete
MNFDPVKTQDDPDTQDRLLIYRDIEKQITQFAIYGEITTCNHSHPIQTLVLQHYKVQKIEELKPKQIIEMWRFAKGLNEIGGLWMVFHGYRRFIQNWIDITGNKPVDLNEFWINNTDLTLHSER